MRRCYKSLLFLGICFVIHYLPQKIIGLLLCSMNDNVLPLWKNGSTKSDGIPFFPGVQNHAHLELYQLGN